MATDLGLPDGFVLDDKTQHTTLPDGFIIDASSNNSTDLSNSDIPTDDVLAYHAQRQSDPPSKPSAWDDLVEGTKEGGRMVAQAGTNVLNIVPEMADVFNSGAIWAANQIGIGDGKYETRAPRLDLPNDLKPQTELGKIGAEALPYLIPLLGPERAASVVAGASTKGGRAAARVADMAQENVIGVLAQNSNKPSSQQNIEQDFGLAMAGSGGARLITPLLGKAYGAINKRFGNTGDGAVAQGTPEEIMRRAAAQDNPELASTLRGLDVKPRADVRYSADKLGITDDLLPSHLSGNQQYQAVEQAIKSRAGSALKVQEDQAILNLSRSAGNLIDEVANVPDALSLNQRVINQFDNRMNALEGRSNILYRRVDNALPPHSEVTAQNTASALERKADDLGGWENLDAIEKSVFKAVNPSQDGVLTYANLNRQRRLVGQALYKNRGPYRDADEGALSYLYRHLSEDQRGALGAIGAVRDFDIAQRLVQMRKGMEEQMVSLRGRNLTGDIANKGSLAVSALAKGNSRNFIELMNSLPTRQMRQEVAGASIRDMLSAGKRGADFNPAGFADWYQNLRSSGNLRILSRHMPRDFMSGLHDVYVVADAIRRAKSHEITTGRLNEFTKRFDAVTASHEIIAKYARQFGTMAGAKFGSLGALGGGSLGDKLAVKARMAGGAASSEAAERFILSPEFQQAAKGITQPPPGGGSAFNERVIRTTKAWKDLYNTLPEKDRRMIARMGILWWANQDEEGQ